MCDTSNGNLLVVSVLFMSTLLLTAGLAL